MPKSHPNFAVKYPCQKVSCFAFNKPLRTFSRQLEANDIWKSYLISSESKQSDQSVLLVPLTFKLLYSLKSGFSSTIFTCLQPSKTAVLIKAICVLSSCFISFSFYAFIQTILSSHSWKHLHLLPILYS